MTKFVIDKRDKYILTILEQYTDAELYKVQKCVMLEIIRREGNKVKNKTRVNKK